MRLLVVGKLNGQLSLAVKMAMSTGAKVAHVETVSAATQALRAGQGADLLMVDYELDIAGLIAARQNASAPIDAAAFRITMQTLENRRTTALQRQHWPSRRFLTMRISYHFVALQHAERQPSLLPRHQVLVEQAPPDLTKGRNDFGIL